MPAFKDPGFAERRTAAAKAKKTALEKFREGSPANDPEFAARQAAKGAVRAARRLTRLHALHFGARKADVLRCQTDDVSFEHELVLVGIEPALFALDSVHLS